MAAVEKYKGTWVRRTQVDTLAPLKPGLDPEHLNPTEQQFVGMSPLWVSSAPAPDLPPELYPQAGRTLPTGEGPVSHDPRDPSIGWGAGHGLDQREASAQRGIWMGTDDGSVGAQDWVHMVDRDGTPHADFVDDENGPTAAYDSPQTHQFQRTGVGQPNDADARPARRQQRWYDRYVDFHRYDVNLRPVVPRVAYTPAPQPAVPGGTQYDSPYASSVTYSPTSPDKFLAPQTRRAPGRWDEAMTTDGTAQTVAGAADGYGLPSWGL